MLKRFLSYYKPHKLIFSLDMLASLIVALVAVLYPMVTRRMLSDLIPNKNYRMILLFGIGLLLLYLLRMLLNYFIQYGGHMMGVRMQVLVPVTISAGKETTLQILWKPFPRLAILLRHFPPCLWMNVISYMASSPEMMPPLVWYE